MYKLRSSKFECVVTQAVFDSTGGRMAQCVKCGNNMEKVLVAGGTEIDCCDHHGVWLDLGELDTIVQYYQKKRESSQPGLAGTFIDSAARGAGFGAGASLARGLIQKLLS